MSISLSVSSFLGNDLYLVERCLNGSPNRNRTGTLLDSQQILSLWCLPVPPSGIVVKPEKLLRAAILQVER